MAVHCWARSLGGCTGSSREHLVSKGLLPDEVSVLGFSWCGGGKKIIRKENLVSRCLCAKHNNLMSDLDQVSINFFSQLKLAVEEDRRRSFLFSKIKRTRDEFKFPQKKYEILDMEKFERWCFKTQLNFMNSGSIPNMKGYDPSPELVEMIFGKRPLPRGFGLAWITEIGTEINIKQSFSFATLRKDGQAVGGLTEFAGCSFVFTWGCEARDIKIPADKAGLVEKFKFIIYHPKEFKLPTNIKINFSWES